MYNDQTPPGPFDAFWTVALVRSGTNHEVHFGVFSTSSDAREAMESGKVVTREGDSLSLRRIRRFPS